MITDVVAAFETAGPDEGVRAVVFTSAFSKPFSAGLDLHILLGNPFRQRRGGSLDHLWWCSLAGCVNKKRGAERDHPATFAASPLVASHRRLTNGPNRLANPSWRSQKIAVVCCAVQLNE